MGYRYYLCGSVRLTRAAWERAQQTPLLSMCCVDDDFNVTMEGFGAKALFSATDEYQPWALNAYDEAAQRWVFGCSLHDDDWDNADPAPLPRAFKKLKDLPGTDLVVVAHDWEWKLARAWTVAPGQVTALKKLPKLEGATSKQLFAGKYEVALASLARQLGLEPATATAKPKPKPKR